MIRSQIAVRPAVVNGPAVRVHLGGGGVDYWSVRLQKPTPPFPHPPETEGSCRWIASLPMLQQSFPNDIINVMSAQRRQTF